MFVLGSTYWRAPPEKGVVIGWGRLSVDGPSAMKLRKTTVKILNDDQCIATVMGKYLTKSVLCAYEDSTDACQVTLVQFL